MGGINSRDHAKYFVKRLIGVGGHFGIGAILNRVGDKHTLHVWHAKRNRLGGGCLTKLGRCDEHGWNSAGFKINDVVHTARRTAASIGKCFDNYVARNGNLVAQVDRRGFSKGWFAKSLDSCTNTDEPAL